MTFEDFFEKKKIDIVKLKEEDIRLLEELKEHFDAMSPKNFDYTKKYLFNKLRGLYPLK